MVTVKTTINDTTKVIGQKIFLANKFIPLAIQRDDTLGVGTYKVLFKVDENITGKSIFFEARIRAEEKLDIEYIESKSIYIENIKSNEVKYSAFKEIMKEFNPNNFYVGDFAVNRANQNYTITAIKSIAGSGTFYYELMNIYIPRYMYIVLALYVEELLDPYSDMERDFLFISPDILSLRFEKVEQAKLAASTKRQREDGLFLYSTMYEFNCGPTFWKFVYEVVTSEDLKLKEPLFTETFDAEYTQYKDRYIGYVSDTGYVYVIVKNDAGKIVALKVPNELIQKTNIVDPYYIFDEEDDI